MANIQHLESFMRSRAITREIVELTLKIKWDWITEETAPSVEEKLRQLLDVEFDEDAFEKIAESYGWSQKDIAASKVEHTKTNKLMIQSGGNNGAIR